MHRVPVEIWVVISLIWVFVLLQRAYDTGGSVFCLAVLTLVILPPTIWELLKPRR